MHFKKYARYDIKKYAITRSFFLSQNGRIFISVLRNLKVCSIFNLSFNITQLTSKYLETPFNIKLILESILPGLPLPVFLGFKL